MSTDYRTNHLWHAFLTIISLGGWAPIWLVISLYNWYKRWRT